MFLVWKKQNLWWLRVWRGRQRQNHSLSWKVKDEQCSEQVWENCCTCARNEQTSCTAWRKQKERSHVQPRVTRWIWSVLWDTWKALRVQRAWLYTFKVRERVFRQRLGRTSYNVQEHKWPSCAVWSATLTAWSRIQQTASMSSAEAE